MAALTLPDTANYEIHEHVKVDTTGKFLFLLRRYANVIHLYDGVLLMLLFLVDDAIVDNVVDLL